MFFVYLLFCIKCLIFINVLLPGIEVGGGEDEARISHHWSRTVLEDILQGGDRPASQCPLLAWGYAPLLHPARLSILV